MSDGLLRAKKDLITNIGKLTTSLLYGSEAVMTIYWVESNSSTRLAIVPRPRGGDWLEDELAAVRREGVDVLISLLTPPEQTELGLDNEADACRRTGIQYMNFAIPDRDVPDSRRDFAALLADVTAALNSGKRVGAHCRAGIGRSSLLIAALLCHQGMPPDEAFSKISEARGLTVPDTPDQVTWLTHFFSS